MLWEFLTKKEVSVAYIRVIKDMYERVKTSVMTLADVTEDFPIDIRLCQGKPVSIYYCYG